MENASPSTSRSGRRWILWILLPLLAGILVSLAIPRPVIGVIYLDDAIYSTTARQMIAQIQYARDNFAVRAVVLVLNTPGGTVSDTEAVYRELAELRQTKPVITVIESMAASGGYYLSAGTDYVIANASSSVGNIGVIGYMPSNPVIVEDIVSTGPYKLWGLSRDAQMREIDMLKQGFWQAVKLGRGPALKGTPEEVMTGQIWTGSEALKLGLIDELGTQSTGVKKAAAWAKTQNYEVVNLIDQVPQVSIPISIGFFYQTADGVMTPYPQKAGTYMLYIPTTEEQQP